eukprot:6193004-Pleurochrysis_carterae.AAC.10
MTWCVRGRAYDVIHRFHCYCRSRSSAVRYGGQDRIFKDHARLSWRVLATLDLCQDLLLGDHPDRAEITNLYAIQVSAVGERARVWGLDAPVGWLRGGAAVRLCRPFALRDPRT